MKFEFDDMGLDDDIELMNIERQMQKNQFKNDQTLGFNVDSLYNLIDNDEQ